jgi:hypothetical protein
VKDLQERYSGQNKTALAYIYCSTNEQQSQTAVNLLGSLLQQLVEQDDRISTEIVSRFKSHDESIPPSMLLGLLKLAVRHFSDTFIIIDALDEYSKSGTGDEFFKGLEELLDSDVHLLITSRHNLMTDYIFRNKASRIEIDLGDNRAAIREDIRMYLHYRIKESPRLNRYVEPDLQRRIIETIAEEADGV